MANFFKEYMVTPNLLNKFSNLGIGGILGNSNNNTQNFGTIGNAANDYIKGTPSQGIISDTITGKNNGNSAITNAIDDYVKKPTGNKDRMMKFANSLSGLGGKSVASPQYQFSPSMVDYSQFMGLSPETQRYLYRGM